MIRRATRADSPAAAAVVRAVYEEYGFTWDPASYHADLADVEASFDAFWVAELDGEVVGCAGLRSAPLVLEGTDCSLERLYVLSSARGSGLGAALVETVAAHARALGRRRLEIWSDKKFADAHRLYERLGARAVADRVHDDPDESAEWGLVLDL